MDRIQLIKLLYHWRDTASYNIFSQQCLHEYFKYMHQNGDEPFDLPGLTLHNGTVMPLTKFILEKGNELVVIKQSANSFITQNWLKETFRFVQEYSKDNKIKIQDENWYHFARLYVNAYSHDGIFKFKDRNLFPISYKNHEINFDMNGKFANLKLQVAYELVEDIIAFAKSKF